MREYMKKYSANRRLKALDILGGCCSKCGSQDGLEIHHIDPSTKSFTLGSGWHHAWPKIEAELKKCEILCEQCHIKHHKSKAEHGTVQRYWRGCKCVECKAAYAAYHKAYKSSKGK